MREERGEGGGEGGRKERGWGEMLNEWKMNVAHSLTFWTPQFRCVFLFI